MNKQCYGWVVSAVRGALVVVGEHVKRSHGFSWARSARNFGGASNVSSVSDVSNVSDRQQTTYISSLSFSSASALLTVSIAASLAASFTIPRAAHAQIIPNRAAPAAQQALVINAANGVPVVNIQTPNASGLSHNRYIQFDVAPQGAILNNAQDAVQTKLGGWVMGNAMVAGKPASVILNEVNSPNPSQLMGMVEVAGKQAQVIVANPAGITCNG
jgi:filamentous hemagglutinin